MDEKIKYIQDHLANDEILTCLAEEAAELAQAALKLRRTIVKTNPTPVPRMQALMNLVEEYADVVGCFETLSFSNVDEIQEEFQRVKKLKRERWCKRIKESRTCHE